MGDFNTPLSSIDRSSKQKINKEIQNLKYTIDQMDLLDVYRTFHPTSTLYTFFSVAHGTFSKIDHLLGHKASLSKYKKSPCIAIFTSNEQKCYVFHIISYVFSSTKRTRGQNRFCQEVVVGRGEMAQTMYTHVSKCKND
jgi:hypothetical protein